MVPEERARPPVLVTVRRRPAKMRGPFIVPVLINNHYVLVHNYSVLNNNCSVQMHVIKNAFTPTGARSCRGTASACKSRGPFIVPVLIYNHSVLVNNHYVLINIKTFY